MDLSIPLTPEWYAILSVNVGAKSSACTALKSALIVDGHFLVKCDDNDAAVILEQARRHCPRAVPDIGRRILAHRRPQLLALESRAIPSIFILMGLRFVTSLPAVRQVIVGTLIGLTQN